MEGNKNLGVRPKGRKVEEGHALDPETLELVNLLSPYKKEFERNFIMKYIKENTRGGIPPIVIERWLSEEHIPSPSIRRDIIFTLKNFPKDSLPVVPLDKPLINSPVVEDILPSTPQPKTTKNSAFQKLEFRITKKEQIVKNNEEKLREIIERLRREGKII